MTTGFWNRHVFNSGGQIEDKQFFRFAGVIDHHFQEEAVKLRFRQGIGAFLLEGVLGGEHHETVWPAGRSDRLW